MSIRSIGCCAAILLCGCSQQQGNPQTAAKARPTAGAPVAKATPEVQHAVAVLTAIGDSGVSGTIHFTDAGSQVEITGTVEGLSPGEHGFHVHEFGDLSNLDHKESGGGHYNPTDMPHGRPEDAQRHVGDLGNLTANAEGTAKIAKSDRVIQLQGPHSIIGRSVVVHAKPDQFTQPTGDAGDRVAVGVIGIAKPK
jgi:Cu-Zn family superoxide dismutase